MTQIMEASKTMSEDQIEDLVSKIRDALRKRASTLPREPVQNVLGGKNIGMFCIENFCEIVEMVDSMIVRRAKVNRSLTPQQVIDSVGWEQNIHRCAVDNMPLGEGEEVDVCFFKPCPSYFINNFVGEAKVAWLYEVLGLKPDPRAQAKVNGDDPSFVDDHPNGSQWPRPNGSGYDFAAFDSSDDGNCVNVLRDEHIAWERCWLLSGVRKIPATPQVAQLGSCSSPPQDTC